MTSIKKCAFHNTLNADELILQIMQPFQQRGQSSTIANNVLKFSVGTVLVDEQNIEL